MVFYTHFAENKAKQWKRELPSKAHSDITKEWAKNATPKSHLITDLNEYSFDGVTYKVDGKKLRLDYSDAEKKIAELLRDKLGGEICMVPRVLSPKGISTPDYIFRGEHFDLKQLSGKSKNVVYNAIAKKKRQVSNFILDITESPLDAEDVYEQIDSVYLSKHTNFVDKLVVVKDGEILSIFERKQKG